MAEIVTVNRIDDLMIASWEEKILYTRTPLRLLKVAFSLQSTCILKFYAY